MGQDCGLESDYRLPYILSQFNLLGDPEIHSLMIPQAWNEDDAGRVLC
jgi:hypothetical protein